MAATISETVLTVVLNNDNNLATSCCHITALLFYDRATSSIVNGKSVKTSQ